LELINLELVIAARLEGGGGTGLEGFALATNGINSIQSTAIHWDFV